MSTPLESEDPGSSVRRTRMGYAPAQVPFVPSRPELVTPVPTPEEPLSPGDTAPELVASQHRNPSTREVAPDRRRVRLVPGKLIPGTRYRLVRWLGEGGMGVVYEAEHIDIERHVALKILRYDLSQQPEMVQVFRDEARAASRMGHVNVVEIFDFGELPDGRLFICMEMLAGADLVPPDGGTLPEHGALIATLRQLCKGLAAAHANGIVHRDIKPENIILVERGGRSGIVKIVDFGISAMMAAGPIATSARIAGTPHYMAPEQIEAEGFDGRLDMYAVGCVAYELLTGTAPFPGEVVEEVLLAQLDNEPTPPSKQRPDRKIPAALEAVVMKCLAKRPDDRYADMNDLEAALCEAQISLGLRTAWDDLPLPPVDPERTARLRRAMPGVDREPARRWLLPGLAIGLGSLVAGVGLTWALMPAQPSAHARDEVDRIAEEALVAASLTHYVAPPPADPTVPTAYKKVLELESLAGDAEALADGRAADLRQRFAAGLTSLGDKYWDVAGARPFAVEYYIWARTFDPDNTRAIDRSGLTDAGFVTFQTKAAVGGFSIGELQVLGLVRAFANESPSRQDELERALAAADHLSLRDQIAVGEALHVAGALPPPRPETPPAPPAPALPTPEPAQPPPPPLLQPVPEDISLEPASAPASEGTHRPSKHSVGTTKRDPARARTLAEAGIEALRAGRRRDAEGLFHQAIAFDNRNAKALMGLSDVYFENGVKQKSVQFAELAVEAAPRSKFSHLKLGDAYYNVLRYRDALKHYEKARDLGEASADGRIVKVTARLGK